ncbi:MAG TPA: hypothetical protein VN892_15390 [Solirubrobacteraceae bacterium]|nr:hypothetical protein [Solirubrobacteraceae bacterium]
MSPRAGQGQQPEQARRRVEPNHGDRGLLELKATERFHATLPVDRDGEEYTLLGRRCPPLPSYTGLVEQAQEGKIGIARERRVRQAGPRAARPAPGACEG